MKLSDLATGSDWIVWIVFVIFADFLLFYFLDTELVQFLDIIQLQKKKRKI